MTLVDNFMILSRLWAGGYQGYFWRKADKHTTWVKLGRAYEIPQDENDLYWGVNSTYEVPDTNANGEPRSPSAVRAQIPYIAAINCFYAEFDAKDFCNNKEFCREYINNSLFAPPSLIIDSGGGYHTYHFFTSPVKINDQNRSEMDTLQKKFVLMTKSDEGAKDMCRVLRVPGTFNAKYTPVRSVEIVDFNHNEYCFEELKQYIETHAPVAARSNPIPAASSNTAGGVKGVVRFLESAPQGERNMRLHWCAHRLYDKGLSLGEVEGTLAPIAAYIGLSEHETVATIRSAQGRK